MDHLWCLIFFLTVTHTTAGVCARPAPLRLRGLASSLFSGTTTCACVILLSVCSSKAGTRSLSRMHGHTLVFYPYVIHRTNTVGPASIRPTHNTNTLSMHGFHTHAQSRLRNMVIDFLPTNPALQLREPAVIGSSCQSACLPTSWPALGLVLSVVLILCVCGWPGTVRQPIVFTIVPKRHALFHAACRAKDCTTHAHMHCSIRMLFIDLSHKDNKKKKKAPYSGRINVPFLTHILVIHSCLFVRTKEQRAVGRNAEKRLQDQKWERSQEESESQRQDRKQREGKQGVVRWVYGCECAQFPI